MLIALSIQALVALLGLAAIFQQVKSEDHFNESFFFHEVERRSSHHKGKHRHGVHNHNHSSNITYFHDRNYPYLHNEKLLFDPGKMLPPKDNKRLLDYEYEHYHENSGYGIDCCPSVLELIEPVGGKNDQGSYVELYKSGSYKQRFYELSCHKDVLEKPCRFVDKKLHEHSRCMQMYSYTYALVKDTPDHRIKNFPTFPGAGSENITYTLDYISVRSGCSCVVKPPTGKKKRKQFKESRKKNSMAGLHGEGRNER
ncbi:uncharacterized protein [Euwallacea similis]|uniref:uncharacterized protein n=1 Tax=Euwallacea similis TaxID=1736056 RepID=UPI00344B645D